MRWSTIRLIWHRELRDQFRDRRTVFMILAVPVILYPILGVLAIEFAKAGASGPAVTIGIQGFTALLPPVPAAEMVGIAAGGRSTPGGGAGRLIGLACDCELICRRSNYPPLLVPGPDGRWHLPADYFDRPGSAERVTIRACPGDAGPMLDTRQVDAVLVVPADLPLRLGAGERPTLTLLSRPGDGGSQHARRVMQTVLAHWKQDLHTARLRRAGLPVDFDEPFAVRDAEEERPAQEAVLRAFHDQIIRIFPFMLVLWSLAGALYPAVDVCAGEKERGTMETLLISPASRGEIVWGKFLTIWVFSALTAVWNLASMGAATLGFSRLQSQVLIQPAAVLWCLVCVLPLTAFFSAVCLAMGVYARSSKEGQYYLMPLFLLTLPLVLLTLAPGVELNGFYSLVPITGVALLMQRLMAHPGLSEVPWFYLVPVVAAVVVYSLLALRWAIEQFKREDVLFREAERLELGLWLRRRFREKDSRTTVGQAILCFVLILVLRSVFFGVADHGRPDLAAAAVGYATFLAPPLFISLLLTARPLGGLGLRRPPARFWAEAVLLAALVLPPLTELAGHLLARFPTAANQAGPQPLLINLRAAGNAGAPWEYALVFGLLPSLSEELIFRGFILSALRGRFSAPTAIVLGACVYALYPLNAFWFLPALAAGLVLGSLRLASGSVLPGTFFAFLCRVLPMAWPPFSERTDAMNGVARQTAAVGCLVLAGFVIWRLAQQVASLEERRVFQPPEEQ